MGRAIKEEQATGTMARRACAAEDFLNVAEHAIKNPALKQRQLWATYVVVLVDLLPDTRTDSTVPITKDRQIQSPADDSAASGD